MYSYLQNVKTKVSNAKRNRPKVNISLKSKRFFIGITSIHNRRIEANHPVTRLFKHSLAYAVLGNNYNVSTENDRELSENLLSSSKKLVHVCPQAFEKLLHELK